MQYKIIVDICWNKNKRYIYGKVKYNIFSVSSGTTFLTLYGSKIIYFDGYVIGIQSQNKKINCYNMYLRMINYPSRENIENVVEISDSTYDKIYKCDIPSKDKPEYRMLIGKEINTPLNKDLLNIVYFYLGI